MKNYFVLIWVYLTISLCCLFTYCPEQYLSKLWVNSSIFMHLIFFFLWIIFSEKRTRRLNWYNPTVLFSLSYIIVFIQIPWLYANFPNLQPLVSFLIPHPEIINKSIFISLIGLSAYYLGDSFEFSYISKKNVSEEKKILFGKISILIKVFLKINWIIFFIFMILAGRGLFGSFVYDGFESLGAGATHFNSIMFIISGLLTAAEALRISKMKVNTFKEFILVYNKSILLFLLVSNLAFLLSGERGTIIAMVFNFITPYYLFIKPLKFSKALILATITAFILSFMGGARTRDSSETSRDRINRGLSLTSDLSIESVHKWPTFHLAVSYWVYNTTLGIIPSNYDYAYGRYLWTDLTQIIPFYQRVFPARRDYVGQSSAFLTNYLTDGRFQYGVGTTVLGAIYMDFGIYGIPIFMFILGFIMRSSIVKVSQLNNIKGVFYLFCFSHLMFASLRIPRSTPFFMLQTLAWGFIIFYLVNLFIDKVIYTKN
jgi:oligosaccharide repeat unit polymerase